jgi:fibronectin type 3 domain-containing protein
MNKITYLLLLTLFGTTTVFAQYNPEEEEITPSVIMMTGEVRESGVSIRWAPTAPHAWQLLNQYGVRLERLTVMRDGEILDEPDVLVLSELLIPEESDEFIRLVTNYTEYPFAAIIAQAIFGESFVVGGTGESDIETIIALSDELLQRFALSLYAADLCFTAALAVGWGWEDTTIKENERYLYRVVPLVPSERLEIEEGALFVVPERIDEFPAPLDFTGEFMDGSVLLSWNARIFEWLYTAYIVERSTDGIHFAPITDLPITRIDASEENEMIFHIDPIENNITFYYRVIGLTIFGTRSEYSDTISGVGLTELRSPPFITSAIPDEQGGVVIEWEFYPENEELIESFSLQRSDNNRDFYDFITPIGRSERSITVPDLPITAHYFAIAANTLTERQLRSFAVLVQPMDTIPPHAPTGLTAVIDSVGVVTLSWDANTDRGSYGYRIFRGRTADEELIPLNDIAHRDTVFTDSINLWTLNHSLFYAVVALNERYTRSDKSEIIEVRLPEVIPPTAPLIREVRVEDGRNTVVWVSGNEPTLAGFHLYRQSSGNIERGFELIALIDDPNTYQYVDSNVEHNQTYIYRIRSRSEGRLTSNQSPDYRVTAVNSSAITAAPPTFRVASLGDRIRLSWSVETDNVFTIQLFKKVGDGHFSLIREGLPSVGEIEDTDVVPGISYQYMLVIRRDGVAPITVIKNVVL